MVVDDGGWQQGRDAKCKNKFFISLCHCLSLSPSQAHSHTYTKNGAVSSSLSTFELIQTVGNKGPQDKGRERGRQGQREGKKYGEGYGEEGGKQGKGLMVGKLEWKEKRKTL